MGEKMSNFFTVENSGIKVDVRWWGKDFLALYKTGDLELFYGLHMMYMIPKVYTEESIKEHLEKCGIYDAFKEAEELITTRTEIFDQIKKIFSETKQNQKARIEELNAQIKEYKKQFKDGKFSQKEYQELIKPLNSEKEKIGFSRFDKAIEARDSIEVKNSTTSHILQRYLEELWENA